MYLFSGWNVFIIQCCLLSSRTTEAPPGGYHQSNISSPPRPAEYTSTILCHQVSHEASPGGYHQSNISSTPRPAEHSSTILCHQVSHLLTCQATSSFRRECFFVFFLMLNFLKQFSNSSSLSYIHFPEITVEIELNRL